MFVAGPVGFEPTITGLLSGLLRSVRRPTRGFLFSQRLNPDWTTGPVAAMQIQVKELLGSPSSA